MCAFRAVHRQGEDSFYRIRLGLKKELGRIWKGDSIGEDSMPETCSRKTGNLLGGIIVDLADDGSVTADAIGVTVDEPAVILKLLMVHSSPCWNGCGC